jgi:hypothetical protein
MHVAARLVNWLHHSGGENLIFPSDRSRRFDMSIWGLGMGLAGCALDALAAGYNFYECGINRV